MAENRSARQQRRERRAAARSATRTARAAGDPAGGTPAGSAKAGDGESLFALPRSDALAVLGLAALVAACYLPALSGGFVWDDVIFSEEPALHRWSGLWSIWFSPVDIRNEGHYWPIVYTTFWLEHKLWGLSPLGYHLVNVMLHAVNTVLVWRLSRALAVPGALAVAAVFAVHPLHVESVAWIIERKDLLSAVFYLSAVLVWIRFADDPRPGRWCAAFALFTAGMLSKSIVVTLPAALVVWHWFKDGRVTGTDLLRLAPFFAVGLGITAADFAYYTSREPLALGYSAPERVLIAARALWFYAGKLVWPADLAVIYPLWAVRAGDALGWLYVAAAAGLAAALWLAQRRIGRGPLAAAAFFVVTLSPVLGFVDYGYMQFSFVADRFQYLAGIGVVAVLVGGAVRGARRLPVVYRNAAVGAFVAVLAMLGTLTWQQSGIYRDEITFFSHIVARNPQARDAHLNLGSALFDANRLDEGYAASLVAVEQRPQAAGAHANLGRALLLLERLDEAEARLERALALDPRAATTWQNFAELRRKQGRYEEAVEWIDKVLAKDVSNALAHAGLGVSLHELKRHEDAVASIDRALALEPEMGNASTLHALSGRALQALGRFDEAERRYLHAARLDPGEATPLVDLSRLRVAQGRFDEAESYLRRALALAPGNTAALQNVAEALRKQGRYEAAVERYREVLAIDPDFAMAHAGKGDALFRLERYEDALTSLGRSVELHPVPPTATARLVLMGKASHALGQSQDAAAHYERAVAIDPRNTEALDHLAMTRFEEKRYDEAHALYRTMLEVQPDNALTHSNLGAALFYLDLIDEALASFERALSLDPELEAARASLERLQKIVAEGER